MFLNLHFFRKHSSGKLDYEKLINYFEEQENFKVFQTSEYVEIKYYDPEFNFSYRYLITRQCRVQRLYDLDPMYGNQNFMMELPLLIPSFLAKEALGGCANLCKVFDFAVYSDTFPNVQPFLLVDMLVHFEKEKKRCVSEQGMQGRMPFNADKLNVVCKYQRKRSILEELYEGIPTGKIVPAHDEQYGFSGMTTTWILGTPLIFPPYTDYFVITNNDLEGQATYVLKRDDFFKVFQKRLVELHSELPDLYMVKGRQAKKTKKEVKKIKKYSMSEIRFKPLRLCDVIEEERI